MKNLKFFLILLCSTSCASIPDVLGCRRRSVDSGFCTYTVTKQSFIVDDAHPYNGKTWFDMEIDAVYLPVESYAKIKEYIINNCKQNNECSQNITSWNDKLNSLDN